MLHKTLYEILDVNPQATSAEIEEAHKLLMRVWHPDRFANSGQFWQKANERLTQVNQAYEILIDPSKRAAYNEQLRQHKQASEPPPSRDGSRPRPQPQNSSGSSQARKGASARLVLSGPWVEWLSQAGDYCLIMALVYACSFLLLDFLRPENPHLNVLTRIVVPQIGICLLLTHALEGKAVLHFRWLFVSLLGYLAYNYFHTHAALPLHPGQVSYPDDSAGQALLAACIALAQYLFGDKYGMSFWWVPVMTAGSYAGGVMLEMLTADGGGIWSWYLGWLALGGSLGLALAAYTSHWFQEHMA